MNENRDNLYKSVKRHGGGMINGADGIGLMVGPVGSYVPQGWVFIPYEDFAGPDGYDLFCDCLDLVQQGRKDWPENVDHQATKKKGIAKHQAVCMTYANGYPEPLAKIT